MALKNEAPAYGNGRFIVRGGAIDVLEGTPVVHRLVVIEFPDKTAARRWYDSPEYQAILPHRLDNATSTLFLVEGV